MERTLAAAITVMMAGTSIWLATAPADARPKPPAPPVDDSATIKVLPKWTYQGDGKLAVMATCSQRQDIRVVTSKMLPYPVDLRQAGNLRINVTDKTKPGKYAITVWCVQKNGYVDAFNMTSVKIVKHLPPFKQPRTPALPRHFKAAVTVSSGPPVVKKTSHGKKTHSKKTHSKKKPKKGH
jgi:hypothetical protein